MINYKALSKENKRKYGTDIGRIGRMLLANRYSDRSQFIYELLQNAEDALKRRPPNWNKRTVRFELTKTQLTVSHFGEIFTEDDVRGICGIDESKKDITAIGRFGIGFKSVNAYTDSPVVHSGSNHFKIDRYVHPVEVSPIELVNEETRIILPFREDDGSAFDEILNALKQLGVRTMLFLRQIEAIEWWASGTEGGTYSRGQRTHLGCEAERVPVSDNVLDGNSIQYENWIVFSEGVTDSDSGKEVGHAELAFLAEFDSDSPLRVIPATDTELVVYFPTIVPTNIDFLIQGPYRTTPSRDNIVRNEQWNRDLVDRTAKLLVVALKGLRDLGVLDSNTLQILPIDSEKFGDDNLFHPIFEATRNALQQHRLLPAHEDGYVNAKHAMLARGGELRTLLDSNQLSDLFDKSKRNIQWLDKNITQDRASTLRHFLMNSLNVKEVTLHDIVFKFDTSFLEKQPDVWIEQLYIVLSKQPALCKRAGFRDLPLLRLEDGSHVPIEDDDGKVCVFLPGDKETGFRTVSKEVCRNEEVRDFLERIGVSEPDLIDDIIVHVLPKYTPEGHPIDNEYLSDLQRILDAYGTDSINRREKLLKNLRKTPFVAAVDAGSNDIVFARPQDVYIATRRLSDLFKRVSGVLLTSTNVQPFMTEKGRNLLVAAGAARYLQPEEFQNPNRFSANEASEMRKRAGYEKSTGYDDYSDRKLRGLDELLDLITKLDNSKAQHKASLLWEALCDLEKQSSESAFQGTYTWFYVNQRHCNFDAEFVERLRSSQWIVGKYGALHSPEELNFENLDWKENHVLRERLKFKPRHLDQLAEKVGIEPSVLSLLKRHDLTTEAQLMEFLDKIEISKSPDEPGNLNDGTVADSNNNGESSAGTDNGPTSDRDSSNNNKPSSGTPPKPITYIRVNATDVATKEGSEAQARRIALENFGIQRIIDEEPFLERTPKNNPGYDLVEKDAADREQRWVEVKVISGAFNDSWVGLSRTQFEMAMDREEAYWLYVVEHAEDPEKANIIRIQNPAGKSENFIFDHGWKILATEIL